VYGTVGFEGGYGINGSVVIGFVGKSI